MKNQKYTLAIIPIRSGSKSIKDKNIKLLNGKPLSFYAIDAAIKSKIFEKIVIASDEVRYFKILKKFIKDSKKLVFFKRSKKNASNKSTSESVITEVLNKYKIFDIAYLIQATSPMLKSNDLKKSLQKYKRNKNDSMLSVNASHVFLWMEKNKKFIPLNYNYKKRKRRQDEKEFFTENGAFYIFNIKKFFVNNNRLFGKIGFYTMPKYRSFQIDNIEDFKLVEILKQDTMNYKN